MSALQFMQKFFVEGGEVFMGCILILLFLGIAVIAERLYMILFVYSGNAAGLMNRVQRFILDNNMEEAVKLCNSNKHSAVYQIFRAALIHADRPFDQIQNHVEVTTLGVVPKLQARLSYLFTIANVATLLGLLGTIFGLTHTFSAVGMLEGSQKQAALSAGISTAMNTTAFGLIVAIPCMLAYGFLYNKINQIIDEIEHYSARLLLLLQTGSQYFDQFKDDGSSTTEQTPKKKVDGRSLEDFDKGLSGDDPSAPTPPEFKKRGDDAA